MYNREAINILLWKAEMPCLNVWGVSQASQLCDRCHISPELCTTTDSDELMNFNTMGPWTGCVQVYMKHVDPMATKAHMVLKHEVSSKLKPILKSLAHGYSPVRSKLPISFTDKYIDFCRQQSSHFCIRR